MARIDLTTTRRDLARRHAPYWRTLSRGRAIGYRTGNGAGTWWARIYLEGKLRHTVIGSETKFTYRAAVERANQWFDEQAGEAPLRFSVLDAIEAYARVKCANKKDTARLHVWIDLRGLAKHVPGGLLARELSELTTAELESWRDCLPVKPATKKRLFNTIAAALSNAHRLYKVGDPRIWRSLETIEIPADDRRRTFIPTDRQVHALIANCEPDFRALVQAAALTGCRYSELAHLEAGDFDRKDGKITVRKSKTGMRTMLLSSAAVTFFREQVKNKLPQARIFLMASGEPWKASNQTERMRAATSIKPFVFYSLRHFVLSKQLAAGIPAALVAKNAGTSEQILKDHYHHIVATDRGLFDRMPAIA